MSLALSPKSLVALTVMRLSPSERGGVNDQFAETGSVPLPPALLVHVRSPLVLPLTVPSMVYAITVSATRIVPAGFVMLTPEKERFKAPGESVLSAGMLSLLLMSE